jgi:hypothetical protein
MIREERMRKALEEILNDSTDQAAKENSLASSALNRSVEANGVTWFGDLLDSITAAIFRQEGMPADYTNPGNLRAAPWFEDANGYRYPDGQPVVSQNGFWVPRTRAEGIAGAYHVVALHIAELQTLETLIYIWAPPSENNSAEYLKNVMEWTGITDASVPLYNLVS